MVHQVRNSIGFALGQIGMSLLLWAAIFSIPAVFLFLVSVSGHLSDTSVGAWWAAGGACFVLCWVVHSRAASRSLFNRAAPQIELHTTFLRARQLDDDILWQDVRNIDGSQYQTGGSVTVSALVLDVVDEGCVELNLLGLDMEMPRLYALACDARETDEERRLAGEAFDVAQEAAPPEAVRTDGYGTEELGEEIERFGPGPGSMVAICFGIAWALGLSAMSLWLYLQHPDPLALIPCGIGLFLGIPLILLGMKLGRVRLVLGRKGLLFVGFGRGYTLRYGDIRRTSILTTNDRPSSVLLMLRDAQVVQLSDLKNLAAAGQRIEELRRT